MAKNFRTKLIVSSLFILLPMLVGLLLWDKTPELLTTHWGLDGQPDGWSGRGMAVFGLPLIMLASHWLCLFITARDPKNKNSDSKALGLVFCLVPIISNYVALVIYSTAFGKEWDQSLFLLLFMGILFIVIGNYLPKCRQNYTMGIKVPWALNNEENWNATHRFAGKVWVCGGILFLLSAFLPEKTLPAVLLALILLLALVPTLYSYSYYKKQLAAGTASKEDASFVPRGMSKGLAYGSLVFVALILIGVAALMFTGDIEYILNENSFTAKASYWADLTVEYAAVESVEYLEKAPDALRINGFGSGRLAMGMFDSPEYGRHTRYCYPGCDSAILLKVEGKTLFLSCESETDTEALYEKLLDRLEN